MFLVRLQYQIGKYVFNSISALTRRARGDAAAAAAARAVVRRLHGTQGTAGTVCRLAAGVAMPGRTAEKGSELRADKVEGEQQIRYVYIYSRKSYRDNEMHSLIAIFLPITPLAQCSRRESPFNDALFSESKMR